MLFNFHLRDMVDIAPWMGADGQHPHLGWFGLSDGWYWVQAGKTELFRYTQALVEWDRRKHPNAQWLEARPYVDYQVARLWEDTLEIMPEALDPIPSRLARIMKSDGIWNAWSKAAEQAIEAVELTNPDESALDALYQALASARDWRADRSLDCGYLVADPWICFWCDERTGYVQWDNRNCILEGFQAWEATVGAFAMPREDFAAEFHAFHHRFLRRMADRIAIAQANWARPDVELDPNLNQNHQLSAKRLADIEASMTQRDPDRWTLEQGLCRHRLYRGAAHLSRRAAGIVGLDSSDLQLTGNHSTLYTDRQGSRELRGLRVAL